MAAFGNPVAFPASMNRAITGRKCKSSVLKKKAFRFAAKGFLPGQVGATGQSLT